LSILWLEAADSSAMGAVALAAVAAGAEPDVRQASAGMGSNAR
jgi:hypothetical protein